MQRFYLPPDQTHGEILVLSDREAHHALNVVRLRPGEAVLVLDGQGARIQCETVACERRAVQLRVVQRELTPARLWPITLLQAVPKGKTFDTIVQKATELGAERIIPLLTRRVVSQIEPGKYPSKLAHWRAIAIESIKQCGSPWLPILDAPMTLADALSHLAAAPATVRLVASLRPGARHPRTVLEQFTGAPRNGTGSVQIWIGPEGDFTEEELDALQATGIEPITLGPLVLRVDTAAIYCLSILNCALNG